jgi:hypothetical protein
MLGVAQPQVSLAPQEETLAEVPSGLRQGPRSRLDPSVADAFQQPIAAMLGGQAFQALAARQQA